MATILVLGVKVPFTTGGQEVLVSTLVRELKARGHEADVIELPYNPKEKVDYLREAALWRSLDLTSFFGKKVDLVIATKFPSYYVSHPKKSLWLVHQHRPVYDLFGTRFSDFSDDPRDEAIRRMLTTGDKKAIGECAFISGISRNVIARLEHYNKLKGVTLYPPLPLGNRYRRGKKGDYILSVGRICSIKRVDMMVKALPGIAHHLSLKVVGRPDEDGVMEYLTNEIAKHHLSHRVQFLGRVTDEELIELYADSFAVYYAPYNEDYGYVTLEGLASGKPIVTATDSGGVLEFITHNYNGLVVQPTTDGVARGFNLLVEDDGLYERMCDDGERCIAEWGLIEQGWDDVIGSLLSPVTRDEAVRGAA